MTWELAFKFVWLFFQLAVVFSVAAWIADHIVQPWLERTARRVHKH